MPVRTALLTITGISTQKLAEGTESFLYLSCNKNCLNSRRKQQKSYPSFGTDSSHMIDVTDSLIIVNENIDQNVELE